MSVNLDGNILSEEIQTIECHNECNFAILSKLISFFKVCFNIEIFLIGSAYVNTSTPNATLPNTQCIVNQTTYKVNIETNFIFHYILYSYQI